MTLTQVRHFSESSSPRSPSAPREDQESHTLQLPVPEDQGSSGRSHAVECTTAIFQTAPETPAWGRFASDPKVTENELHQSLSFSRRSVTRTNATRSGGL